MDSSNAQGDSAHDAIIVNVEFVDDESHTCALFDGDSYLKVFGCFLNRHFNPF